MQLALLWGQGNGMITWRTMALMQAVLDNTAETKCCMVAGQCQMATHICSRSPRPMALLQRHLSCSICKGTSQQLRGKQKAPARSCCEHASSWKQLPLMRAAANGSSTACRCLTTPNQPIHHPYRE